MSVLDKWRPGAATPDRDRKTTSPRPASSIGSTVRDRQTAPIRPVVPAHPAVPVKRKEGVPVSEQSPLEPTAKPSVAESPAKPSVKESPAAGAFDEALQAKLDRYFARLRAVYPSGVISHLNTGQKKLAERGAKLRKLCGMENELDAFFALGGFTYERSVGGRPRNAQTATASACNTIVAEIRSLFPNGITSAAELDRFNHALYLQLRCAARLSGETITAFLKRHELYIKRGKEL